MRRHRWYLIPLALMLATCAADSPVEPESVCPEERWSIFGSMNITNAEGWSAHEVYYWTRCFCHTVGCNGEP